MNIVIIAKSNMVPSVNQWIKKNLNPEGGDNVTVPLVDNTGQVTHYGCNYSIGDEITADKLRNGVINSPHVMLYTNRPFDEAVRELGLTRQVTDL